MNELALFAGVGGGLLGTAGILSHRVVAAVEISPYRREVLLRRQRDGMLGLFPVWDDIRTFDGRRFRGVVDLVSAGFPCQPFSQNGRHRGEDDDRNLWPETARVIEEVAPPLVFLENVPGLLLSGYFGEILGTLSDLGYDAVWDVVSVAQVGGTHLRARVWVLAWRRSETDVLADAATPRLQGWTGEGEEYTDERVPWPPGPEEPARWEAVVAEDPLLAPAVDPESEVRGVADVLANRVDRIAAAGDGQVPLVVAAVFTALARVALRRAG